MVSTTQLLKAGDVRRNLSDESTERCTEEKVARTCLVPLTAALLDVALHGVSFATPGHRGGRSWHTFRP